ncbi:exopolysaccharide biosynthesis protein [Acuticoccus sp. MNP-M23]|uniref:exopolysaccharide biosynthesis protein n=1 Tax=Acuticoccus sp. MNP-M23 TaxID=3072793 RepID=UPI0028161CCD|nr:exopolysaccharide biosynthesis protein [Acuticoccus sp. MNP-M23]WMS44889.1 exopolysaccharide biosynthesis protein [Acuticoccus sp. MNP-M23]
MDQLEEPADGGDVSINEVLAVFDDRSSGVLITMLGLVAALPIIGGIPGMSMIVSVLLIAVLIQSAVGGSGIRLPGRLGRYSFPEDGFRNGIANGRKFTGKVDRVLTRRLTFLTGSRAARLAIKIAVAILAVAMFPLEVVPWGVTAPAAGIVAFGLAMIARDGLFALFGYALAAVTAYLFTWFV